VGISPVDGSWRRTAGIAVLAGALGAALAAASLALGGASFKSASTVTLCVDANDGVNYRSSGCIAGETALQVGASVPAATANGLTAIGANDQATLLRLQRKLRRLSRNRDEDLLYRSRIKPLLRAVETITRISRTQHQKSNAIIENIRG
jgi:hypothetical protein